MTMPRSVFMRNSNRRRTKAEIGSMTMQRTGMYFILLIIIVLFFSGCAGILGLHVPHLSLRGGPYYFSTWQVPYITRVMHVLEKYRISHEEALALDSEGGGFVEAYFDKYGRIVIFKRYQPGVIVNLLAFYTYGPDDYVCKIETMNRVPRDFELVRIRVRDNTTDRIIEERFERIPEDNDMLDWVNDRK